MIQKIIQLKVRTGCLTEFLARQQIWNDAMAGAQGFVGSTVGVQIEHQNWVSIVIEFDRPSNLNRFMELTHERLENSTLISELIEEISVQILEVKFDSRSEK